MCDRDACPGQRVRPLPTDQQPGLASHAGRPGLRRGLHAGDARRALLRLQRRDRGRYLAAPGALQPAAVAATGLPGVRPPCMCPRQAVTRGCCGDFAPYPADYCPEESRTLFLGTPQATAIPHWTGSARSCWPRLPCCRVLRAGAGPPDGAFGSKPRREAAGGEREAQYGRSNRRAPNMIQIAATSADETTTMACARSEGRPTPAQMTFADAASGSNGNRRAAHHRFSAAGSPTLSQRTLPGTWRGRRETNAAPERTSAQG